MANFLSNIFSSSSGGFLEVMDFCFVSSRFLVVVDFCFCFGEFLAVADF
jgi:hypothetical protein